MAFGVKLRVSGDYACFTRPEMKVERVSYDVMTPSAARGMLEAIHWKPAIKWIVEEIRVLKPIRFQSIRRNEVGAKVPSARFAKRMKAAIIGDLSYSIVEENRQQRAATVLADVSLYHLCALRADTEGRRQRQSGQASRCRPPPPARSDNRSRAGPGCPGSGITGGRIAGQHPGLAQDHGGGADGRQ